MSKNDEKREFYFSLYVDPPLMPVFGHKNPVHVFPLMTLKRSLISVSSTHLGLFKANSQN